MTTLDMPVRAAKRDPAAAEAGPNPHLYQSLASLAAGAGFMEEARAWFSEAVSGREGSRNAALWHAWAMAEARGGEPGAVRYLFPRGLEASPRSRYIHLSWALWEARAGEVANARRLLARGVGRRRRGGGDGAVGAHLVRDGLRAAGGRGELGGRGTRQRRCTAGAACPTGQPAGA